MPTYIQGRPSRRLPELIDEVRRGTALRITEYGEEILHRPCRPVTEFGAARWGGLIDDMFTTMWIAEGCGLAANQVDVDAQLFVYDLTDEYGDRHVGHAFNPRVVPLSAFFGDQDGTEGCLSVPGANAPLPRPARVTLHADDLEGNPFTLNATGYLARCLTHPHPSPNPLHHPPSRSHVPPIHPPAPAQQLARLTRCGFPEHKCR
jgi:peptide deformylase